MSCLASECTGCHQQVHVGSKTSHQQNPVLDWRCQLTQVDLYSGCKTAVVVVVKMNLVKAVHTG